jgi:hypothetical protein
MKELQKILQILEEAKVNTEEANQCSAPQNLDRS